ncbi:fam-a protein [Plasmodium yoelii yoelii]|uniref:Fam-a protein n=1 Tax=Plasmodium yoelii yoelii TaxID=73239 RepID=A0AAE9WLF1_PLAYO|nr:fam-a protein [Plasmodium yoelii yoelii]
MIDFLLGKNSIFKNEQFYIQIIFFLLSISIYVNNTTLAAEPVPGEDAAPELTYHYLTSEEIYEKNTHLLCTDPKETIKADEVMNEAVELLKYHATSIDDYELCDNNTDNSMLFYNKRHQGYINVEKIEYKINNLNKYNELVNQLWDPDSNLLLNKFSVKRKIVRLYSPNLVMIQHRCKIWPWSRRKYFYALSAKYKVRKTFLSYFVINHIFRIIQIHFY